MKGEKHMKKRVKPSWRSLTKGEKMGVILFYILGVIVIFGTIAAMYLKCPLFW